MLLSFRHEFNASRCRFAAATLAAHSCRACGASPAGHDRIAAGSGRSARLGGGANTAR
jgi:hypothetical protein